MHIKSFWAQIYTNIYIYFTRGNNCINTVSKIIPDTTNILECLKEIYMPASTSEKWNTILDRFQELWNLINCMDAIDIRIQTILVLDSSNFNYIIFNYNSLVIIVISYECDADGIFTTIDVGQTGRNNDGVFRACHLG